jgi:hypothetical protein
MKDTPGLGLVKKLFLFRCQYCIRISSGLNNLAEID